MPICNSTKKSNVYYNSEHVDSNQRKRQRGWYKMTTQDIVAKGQAKADRQLDTYSYLSASVVNYNTHQDLDMCLASLEYQASKKDLRIWVVDNDSEESIQHCVQKYPGVHFIYNQKNVGYGTANNLVVRRVQSKYHLIINPDIILEPAAIQAMVRYMNTHPQVGILGPKVLGMDGTRQPTFRRFPTLASFLLRGFKLGGRGKKLGKYLMQDVNPDRTHQVDWVIGCCMLARTKMLTELHGFDENYFMYYEDVDLCYRARQAGWEIVYHPQSVVRHGYRRDSAKHTISWIKLVHVFSALRYFVKYLKERKWKTFF